MVALINDKVYGNGTGGSKKEAEQDAAKNTLKQIKST
jgi:dsRNA-specific ribonuclease